MLSTVPIQFPRPSSGRSQPEEPQASDATASGTRQRRSLRQRVRDIKDVLLMAVGIDNDDDYECDRG